LFKQSQDAYVIHHPLIEDGRILASLS